MSTARSTPHRSRYSRNRGGDRAYASRSTPAPPCAIRARALGCICQIGLRWTWQSVTPIEWRGRPSGIWPGSVGTNGSGPSEGLFARRPTAGHVGFARPAGPDDAEVPEGDVPRGRRGPPPRDPLHETVLLSGARVLADRHAGVRLRRVERQVPVVARVPGPHLRVLQAADVRLDRPGVLPVDRGPAAHDLRPPLAAVPLPALDLHRLRGQHEPSDPPEGDPGAGLRRDPDSP